MLSKFISLVGGANTRMHPHNTNKGRGSMKVLDKLH